MPSGIPEIAKKRINICRKFSMELSKKQALSGRKFRRQHSIENMIVDFYCLSEKLIIELDGHGHTTVSGQEDDCLKDLRLKKLGLKC